MPGTDPKRREGYGFFCGNEPIYDARRQRRRFGASQPARGSLTSADASENIAGGRDAFQLIEHLVFFDRIAPAAKHADNVLVDRTWPLGLGCLANAPLHFAQNLHLCRRRRGKGSNQFIDDCARLRALLEPATEGATNLADDIDLLRRDFFHPLLFADDAARGCVPLK